MRYNPAHLHLLIICLLGGIGLTACQGHKVLRADGLKHVRLGQEMPLLTNKQFQKVAVRDTLLEGAGYAWDALILDYPEGDVWIEADFFGQDRVNRIRVETPEVRLRGQKGLQVGTTAEVLKALHPRWQITYLQDYQVYDAVDPMASSFHYLFPAPSTVPERPTIQDLADKAKVVAVVVM